MNSRRTSSGTGPNPISHADLDAWARVRQISLSPFEITALDKLEALYMSQAHQERAAK